MHPFTPIKNSQETASFLSGDQIKAASTLQRHVFRSTTRYDEHMQCFTKPPEQCTFPTKLMLERCPEVLDLIHTLAEEKAIIPEEVSHITTWNNASSICKCQALFGATSLKKRNITYTENVLGPDDCKNGDGDIICTGSYLIDFRAVLIPIEKGGPATIKNGAIQVKFNLSHAYNESGYHKFFKLKDLLSQDYLFVLNMTKSFKVMFDADKSDRYGYQLAMNFYLKDVQRIIVHLTKEDCLFYGNLYQINRFCLLSLFKLIEKSRDQKFIDSFYNMIKACNIAKKRKILKLFAQHLAIFCECNFSAQLSLTHNRITQIDDLENGQRYSFKDLTPVAYQEKIEALSKGDFASLIPNLPKEHAYHFNEEGTFEDYWGCKISTNLNRIQLRNPDFRSVNAEKFIGTDYVNYVELGQKEFFAKDEEGDPTYVCFVN